VGNKWERKATSQRGISGLCSAVLIFLLDKLKASLSRGFVFLFLGRRNLDYYVAREKIQYIPNEVETYA
jgi:hypothetical protein